MIVRRVKRLTCWIVGLSAVLLLMQGCANTKKQQLTLRMDRQVVPVEPNIESVQLDKSGELDTRDTGYTIQCTMKGASGLDATLDVSEKIKG